MHNHKWNNSQFTYNFTQTTKSNTINLDPKPWTQNIHFPVKLNLQITMSSTNPNFPPGPYAPGEHIMPPARPASPATEGYRINHLMMRIKDPEASLKFYCDCMGLHVVFIFNPGPWTIYYLGPRDVGTYRFRSGL